jgi:uncharacterized protein
LIGRLSDEEMDRLLREQTLGHLGCSANGRSYVIPLSYVYEDGSLYGHAAEGLKLQMIRHNPEVCFQVDSIAGTSSWRSVIVWGTFEMLAPEQAAGAMRRFVGRMQPNLTGTAAAGEQMIEQLVALALTRGVAYRIVVREKSGRYEA